MVANCTISELSRTSDVGGANLKYAAQSKWATFQKNNTKLYCPVVTSSINDNIDFWEYLKQGFKRTIS